MVFTSPVFLFLFLPLVLGIYYLLRKEFRNVFLFIASSFFYFYGEQKMLLLMYFVILLNYAAALLLDYLLQKAESKPQLCRRFLMTRKIVLALCIMICIGLLWHYKYWNFTLEIFNKIFAAAGIGYKLTVADKIILPLGISFYTFHVLSYTFDVYCRRLRADKNVLHFMTYVLMFPQLVAGPIVRYIDIQRQFKERTVSLTGFANGIRRFCFGLAKKVLIANTVAKTADKIFAVSAQQLDAATAWLGAVCYTLQIYFDFSGYSDMAIGLAALFGFHYKENFNYPYISKTVGEFWRRWHISLSTWLRDYVYINLGGSRSGKIKYYCNILLVFLLSGLWHGANMTFVLWGVWYGIFIILESIFLQKFLRNKPYAAHVYALIIIVFGWVLFRADSVKYALRYWLAMLGLNGASLSEAAGYIQNDGLAAVIIGCVLSYDWRNAYKALVCGKTGGSKHLRFTAGKLLSYGMAFILALLSVMSILSSTYNPFIYFRF